MVLNIVPLTQKRMNIPMASTMLGAFIDIFDNKQLAGISKDGGFVIDDVFSNSSDVKNFYSFTDNYHLMKYPKQTDIYFGKLLTYIIGEKESPDIKFDNDGNLYFINSNIFTKTFPNTMIQKNHNMYITCLSKMTTL